MKENIVDNCKLGEHLAKKYRVEEEGSLELEETEDTF